MVTQFGMGVACESGGGGGGCDEDDISGSDGLQIVNVVRHLKEVVLDSQQPFGHDPLWQI